MTTVETMEVRRRDFSLSEEQQQISEVFAVTVRTRMSHDESP